MQMGSDYRELFAVVPLVVLTLDPLEELDESDELDPLDEELDRSDELPALLPELSRESLPESLGEPDVLVPPVVLVLRRPVSPCTLAWTTFIRDRVLLNELIATFRSSRLCYARGRLVAVTPAARILRESLSLKRPAGML